MNLNELHTQDGYHMMLFNSVVTHLKTGQDELFNMDSKLLNEVMNEESQEKQQTKEMGTLTLSKISEDRLKIMEKGFQPVRCYLPTRPFETLLTILAENIRIDVDEALRKKRFNLFDFEVVSIKENNFFDIRNQTREFIAWEVKP